MKSWAALFLLVVVGLPAILVGVAEATICYEESITLRQISGIVVVDDGFWWAPDAVVPGATVELSRGRYYATAVTDRDGFFRFSSVGQGNYQIRAGLEGFFDAVGEIRVRKVGASEGRVLVMALTPYLNSCGHVTTKSLGDARRLQQGLLPRGRLARARGIRTVEAPTEATVWVCGEDKAVMLKPSFEMPALAVHWPGGRANCRFTPSTAEAWNLLAEAVAQGKPRAGGSPCLDESPCSSGDTVAVARALSGESGTWRVSREDDSETRKVAAVLHDLLKACDLAIRFELYPKGASSP